MIDFIRRVFQKSAVPCAKIFGRFKARLARRDIVIPEMENAEHSVVITIRQAVAEIREAEQALTVLDTQHQEAGFLRLACAREQLNSLIAEAKAENISAKFVYTGKGRENKQGYLYC